MSACCTPHLTVTRAYLRHGLAQALVYSPNLPNFDSSLRNVLDHSN